MLFLLFINLVTCNFITAYFGVFDDSYNLAMKDNIPWKMFDRLIIGFANLDNNSHIINENPNDHQRILNVSYLYKKARPDGELFISMYDDRYDRFLYAANNTDIFSKSVAQYLDKYKMNGMDLDWETVLINVYSNELVKLLKSCYGKLKITHAIWPDVHDPKTVGLLANIVDEINIMSYEMGIPALEKLINSYNKSGFPYEKMVLGMETESQKENKNTIVGKLELVQKYKLAGMFVWRLDNDPGFKTVKMLYENLKT
jgi:GH18 family chitinase